jgi:hypothetical protein
MEWDNELTTRNQEIINKIQEKEDEKIAEKIKFEQIDNLLSHNSDDIIEDDKNALFKPHSLLKVSTKKDKDEKLIIKLALKKKKEEQENARQKRHEKILLLGEKKAINKALPLGFFFL